MPYKSKKLKGIQGGSLDALTGSVVDFAKFVEDEFAQVATDLQATEPDTIWNKAPPKPRRGTYAYADGTNWNPGFGEGPYYFNGTIWLPMGAGGATTAPGAGRMVLVSATQIKFAPFYGTTVKISGVLYTIPAAGVLAGNTSTFINGVSGNLAASTVYYVYVFNNAGVLALDFSTTGRALDADGTMIKTGDATRSLVGMVRTNASSQFEDTSVHRGVASWFNRLMRQQSGTSVAAAVITGTGSWTEPSTGARIDGVYWSDDAILVTGVGLEGQNDTTGQLTYGAIGIDGVGAIVCESAAQLSPNLVWVATSTQPVVGEGYHFFTPAALVSGGTGHFWGTAYAMSMG